MKFKAANLNVSNTLSVMQMQIGNNAIIDKLSLGSVAITPSNVVVGSVTVNSTTISTPQLIVGGVGYSGEQFSGIIDYQEFTADNLWSNPLYNPASNSGLTGNEQVLVMLWGAGGGGNTGGTTYNSGGGGGACALGYYTLGSLPSSVSVTVGLGGTAGVNGGSSSFGSLIAYGGAAANSNSNTGGGGGILSQGANTTGGGPLGGAPGAAGATGGASTFGGGGGTTAQGSLGGCISIFGGCGGSGNNNPGGNSIFGGGGGAGRTVTGSVSNTGGISVFGGPGANLTVAATIPGGGGAGSNNSSGADGQVRVWTFGTGGTTLGLPTYSLTSNTTSVYETEAVLYTVSTTNVANGTTLYYTLNNSSSATSADFAGDVNGSIIINGGVGYFTLGPVDDSNVSPQPFQMDIRTGNSTGTIVASNGSVSIIPLPQLDLQYQFIAAKGGADGSDSASFTNVPIGTASSDRIVIFCISKGNGATSKTNGATLDGTAMTLVANASGGAGYNIQHIFYLPAPTGTTANLAFTGSGGADSYTVTVFTLKNQRSNDPVYSSINVLSSNNINITTDTIPAGSLILAVGSSSGRSSYTWNAPMVELTDYYAPTGTYGCTQSTAANNYNIVSGPVNITAVGPSGGSGGNAGNFSIVVWS